MDKIARIYNQLPIINMRAQRLSVLLTVLVCVHLVYSENLAQDDHVSEGEDGTESVAKMEDTTESVNKMEDTTESVNKMEDTTVDITNTTVEISSSTTPLSSTTTTPTTITSTFTTSTTITPPSPATHSTSIDDTIELIEQISSLLLRSTLIMNSTRALLEELQVFLPKIPILKRRHQIQTSYITSKQPLTISTTTVRAHYRRKMKKKKKKPCRVSTKIQKEHRKCKGERKVKEQTTIETHTKSIKTVADLPPLNIKMYDEEKYFRRDDSWRYQVYRCWIHRACHFGW